MLYRSSMRRAVDSVEGVAGRVDELSGELQRTLRWGAVAFGLVSLVAVSALFIAVFKGG